MAFNIIKLLHSEKEKYNKHLQSTTQVPHLLQIVFFKKQSFQMKLSVCMYVINPIWHCMYTDTNQTLNLMFIIPLHI